MTSWYSRVTRDPNDLSPVLDAIEYFDREYLEAVAETDRLEGDNLINAETRLAGIVGRRYEQLLEMSAIIEYLEIRETAIMGTQRRHYIEHYNRALSERMVDRFSESHPDVIALREMRVSVSAVRNKFIALSRRHEYLHYQLTNITKLRVADIHDAIL